MVVPSWQKGEGILAGIRNTVRGETTGVRGSQLSPGRSEDGGVSDTENGACEKGFTLQDKGNPVSAVE